MFGWKTIDTARYKGTRARGDQTVPPTRWWNHLYLLFFRWRQVTVFSLDRFTASQGYRVGFKPFAGKSMITAASYTSPMFRVRNGREDCAFFAISALGIEIPLTEVVQTDISDPEYSQYQLI